MVALSLALDYSAGATFRNLALAGRPGCGNPIAPARLENGLCVLLRAAELSGKVGRVKHLRVNPFSHSRYVVAIAAGLLLTAAFPNIDIAGFAWLAPGLMVAAALGKSGGESFRLGFVAGLTHYLTMLYWLLLIPYRWHGIPLGPAVGWLALCGGLALVPATWVWLVAPIYAPRPGGADAPQGQQSRSPSGALSAPESFFRTAVTAEEFEPLRGVLARSWIRRTGWALKGAAIWVALEMFLARILGGFPWDLLGVSQHRMVPLIQVASYTGVHGVSFLIVWLSLSLLSAVLMLIRRPTGRSVWVVETFVPVLTVAILFNLGLSHLRHELPAARTVRIALVQPSIPQTLIWSAANDSSRFTDLLRLSDKALAQPADILIWPEAAVPKMLRYDPETFEAIAGLARRHHVWMIVGSDDAEPRRGSNNPEDAEFFNSSFLLSPQGDLVARYVKRDLVIFGEYTPLQQWLPFLKYFTPIQGGFTPGTHDVEFRLRDLQVQTSVLICFEDIFPQLARSDMRPETDFLVNITNDGWFDQGAAQWQQGMTGLFRAVENGVPLIRCANNGLTCWIDGNGRLREVFRDERGTIYGAGFLRAEVPVPPPDAPHPLTFYTRHGDWFGWGCVGVGGIVLLFRIIGAFRLRRRSAEPLAIRD